MKKARLLLSALLLTLTACQERTDIDLSTLTERERQAVEALAWLRQADAKQDAQVAIVHNDLRLLALSGRVPVLPGVATDRSDDAKRRCGIRPLEGTTDTVLGDTHRILLQRASDYAAEYNRIMIAHCLKVR
ncbi:MAG: glutamyl-tRNA amidotransferase [Candidatus Thiodiazotropha sp.]